MLIWPDRTKLQFQTFWWFFWVADLYIVHSMIMMLEQPMSVVKLFKEMELLELSAVCDSFSLFFSLKYLISFVGKLGGAVIEFETKFCQRITVF